jgi:UDP:flavonoid glycosyltransferase YjiC (YdhE family)
MRILLAPLNWGLGHASRCVPLVQRLLDEGHEVVLGGDGDSLTLLRKHFPKLRYVYLAPLKLRYSSGKRQVWAVMKMLPQLIAWSIRDHAMLQAVLREEQFDQVISDNRFGLYSSQPVECIYMTHQVRIRLPRGWQWAEPIAARLHAHVYTRFNKVWVPDRRELENSLAGELSHPKSTEYRVQNADIEYIGPLSRFENLSTINSPRSTDYNVVAVLSGLEPQRTQLEKEIVERYMGREEKVLIVQGLPGKPLLRMTHRNITLVPYMNDSELAQALCSASHIIARSGYSTIMDLEALGLLDKAELIPTPGQPEQEYLSEWLSRRSQ